MESSTFLIAAFAVLSVGYYLFSLLYPKPLPGIPFQIDAVKKPLGDIAELKRMGQETRETSLGMFSVASRLGVPVCQLLLTSFTKPLIVVNDPRESEDIIMRRNREFDRSLLTTHIFEQVLPASTLAQITTPDLKARKRKWSDVMNTDFLRRVVAPNIHLAANDLVDLWSVKSSQAGGKPFDVEKDFMHAALDAIWVAVLGTRLGIVRREIEKLDPTEAGNQDPEHVRRLETASMVEGCMEFANELVNKGLGAIWPGLTYFFIRQTSEYKHFINFRDHEIRRLMSEAVERFNRLELHSEKGEGESEGEEHDTCAMDLVLRRDVMAARRSGKPLANPADDPAMVQELLLMLLAGHDSTANTLMWFVKLMAAYQQTQAELRHALKAAFPNGAESAAAILDADIPYLDATVEETVRVSGTSAVLARRALVDTQILGHPIPKGSNIICNTRILAPPVKVPEEIRSATSQSAQAKRPRGGFDGYPGRDLDVFEPRRWLTKDETGKEVFDAYALPNLIFGGGLRGCFGKKLAMQELKIIMVQIVLNFEFLPLPEELRDMKAIERVFRQPVQCHVKLRPL